MKHLVGFFLPLCIFSFIAFVISVAVLGTPTGAIDPQSQVRSEYTVLDEQYSRIELKNSSGNLNIYPSDSDSTIITTKSSYIDDVSIYIKDDTLIVKTENVVWGWGSNGFDFSLDTLVNLFTPDDRTVNVFVPVKVYNSITSANASGKTRILEIPATLTDLTNSSGTIIFAQPDDFRSERISVKSASGICTVYNASTYSYEVDLGSGYVELYDLTGKGSVDISSGSCELNYAELNADLSIDVSSGNLDVNIPVDSSAEILCDISSGDVDIEIGGEDEDLEDGDNLTINGGEHRIIIDLSSGDVNISDDVQFAEAPLPELPHLMDYAQAVATTALNTETVPVEAAVTTAYGVHVDDNEVDVNLGVVDVNVNDNKVDVNVGPIGVNVDNNGVKVDIGDNTIVDIG